MMTDSEITRLLEIANERLRKRVAELEHANDWLQDQNAALLDAARTSPDAWLAQYSDGRFDDGKGRSTTRSLARPYASKTLALTYGVFVFGPKPVAAVPVWYGEPEK